MRYRALKSEMFVEHRANLARLLPPNSLVVLNANDIPPTNADGTLPFRQNSALFYLCGVDQEETILLLYPDAHEEHMREILFLRETTDLIATWEAQADQSRGGRSFGNQAGRVVVGISALFHRLMCECEHVFLNTNEHKRAVIEVESRDARFIRQTQARYPLHHYCRLAPLLHRLRAVKTELEVEVIRQACAITKAGFLRVCRKVKPGVKELELEAEFAREFIRRGATFAYNPIIASGPNACVLHYIQNDQTCRAGQLLLLDVAAAYANYNSDLTRTLPVSGRFTRHQRRIYNAVLRVLRAAANAAVPGKLPKQWQKDAEALMQEELLSLGLLKPAEVRRQNPEKPALKKYFHARRGPPARAGCSRRGHHHRTNSARLGHHRRARHLHPRGRSGRSPREQLPHRRKRQC
jgi:Xaa-Pro aminopeptidase